LVVAEKRQARISVGFFTLAFPLPRVFPPLDLGDQRGLMKTFLPCFSTVMSTVAVLGLLAGAGCTPKPPEHGTAFLVEADLSSLPPSSTPEEVMARTGRILHKRLDKLGVNSFVEPVGTNRLQIKVRRLSDDLQQAARVQLARGGVIEFRLVHEQNESLVRESVVPADYEVKRETRVLPGGEKEALPMLVQKKAAPGCSGRNVDAAYASRDSTGRPQIAFKFDAEGTRAFADLTASNVGRRLAILLDGELYSAPVIRSAITQGNGIIQGSFTDKEAFDLASVLGNPLETPVRVITETSF
jgi:SecD/SecF fusion protein